MAPSQLHTVGAEGEDRVLIQDDGETAIRLTAVFHERAEFVLKYRPAAGTGYHGNIPPFPYYCLTVYLNMGRKSIA